MAKKSRIDVGTRTVTQAYLYLLCYVFERYQKLNDNLVDAFCFHERQIHDEAKERAQQAYAKQQAAERRRIPLAGRLLLLYVADEFGNQAPFGEVRQRAFSILPKKEIESVAEQMLNPKNTQLGLRWEMGDQLFRRVRKRLRPLFQALDFSSTHSESPWLQAIRWMQDIFLSKQSISQRPLEECPMKTIPERLHPYLLRFDATGEAIGLQANRYESWIYHQTRARLLSGELFLNDTTKHRAFQEELASLNNQENLNQLDIFWLRKPIEVHLDTLLGELDTAWEQFNADFSQRKLKHLDYDVNKKTLHWRKSKAQEAAEEDEKKQQSFYAKLPVIDIANVLRFANETNFLSAFTPLQPRYAKQMAHEDSLLATILAQAMGHGNWSMAEMSDIPYHTLEFTQQQYLRLATLQSANDLLSNAISKLSIFPHYSFDPEILYGSVDGQKFDVETENIRARHSRKYFRNGAGVSAYSLLANHIPLQTKLIGAHEHESYFLFDIWYNNTSDITPAALTGDMHSINRMNFILTYCFGVQFCPWFTSLDRQLKHLYCSGEMGKYSKDQIQPVGSINRSLIIEQKENIERIIKALALKETTQSNLVRKLCTHVQNPAYKGMAELDKAVRSIYTLRYLRDPRLYQNVHRSQNRIESYHQIRADIAQVGGKKQLIGKTETALEIANQCGRLVANAMIYYNSVILSRLYDSCVENNDQAGLSLLKKRSPVASQHIHLLGRYTFYTNKQTTDINDMVKNIVL